MSTIDAIEERRVTIAAVRQRGRLHALGHVVRILEWIAAQSAKRRSRRALLALTSDQLRDVGLTSSDVRREMSKSWFWD